MATGSEIKARLQSYIDSLASGDVDAVMAHYAEAATCEDPVGGKLYRGLAEIRAFYEGAIQGQKLQIEPVTPLISTTTNYAAMGARVNTSRGVIHFVETQLFDEAGKIIEMRAYYDPADIAAA
ncbi:MAG: steroid delta-isomerase [Caulobacteraceae bacterium]|nr:steroid delta-isomerase [Caulobacteraceae bacterium]